ncbi:MAG: D-glycero-beta-D-manno-heptose-7-phosphate kinase [Desulfobulbus propionicus]|nr:MAG: D-glycero-beta-D-manno-heptose-7-phosphate kinase [Desulfobulbus propionicus]
MHPQQPKAPEGLSQVIERFRDAKVLVIGDIIVDHFIWGTVARISPEAPVPVVNVTREELLLGGAANVLRNIISLGGSGALCGIAGRDAMGGTACSLLAALPAESAGVIHSDRPTTVKTRIIAQGQQVVRFDREQAGDVAGDTLSFLLEYLEENVSAFDAVVISDYAKGVVNEGLMVRLHRLLEDVRRDSGRSLPLIVDPKPANMHRFVGATVITPNHHEAALISGLDISDEQTLWAAARRIHEDYELDGVLVTRGEAGMALLEGNEARVTIPTNAKEVYDVTGAGDTVAATMALGMAVGCSMADAALLANYAAGIVVGKVGTASVSLEELHAVVSQAKRKDAAV